MTKIVLLLLSLSLGVVWAQDWTLDDVLEMKAYGMSEEEILVQAEKMKAKGVTIPIDRQAFLILKQYGFSSEFIRNFREIMQTAVSDSPPRQSGQMCKIRVSVRPPGAGEIRFEPKLDGGMVKKGTQLKIVPKARAPYLFDHWEGDAKGYRSISITAERNMNIIAYFQKPLPPEHAPSSIEDPKAFRDTRRANHRYRADVLGKVEGRGRSKDWGIVGEVYYNYLYRLRYTSDVIENDGFRIVEKRTFDSVEEMLMISKYQFHLDIREDTEPVKRLLAHFSFVLKVTGKPELGMALDIAVSTADRALEGLEKVVLDKEGVRNFFRTLEDMGIGNEEKFEELEKKISDGYAGRMLGYAPQMKLLEGKTFLLEYEDGLGLVGVSVPDEDQVLSIREKELLERAFYLSDYYIFKDSANPKRTIKPGDTWEVDARNLAGNLDPRLRHRAKGSIHLYRDSDLVVEGRKMAVFKLLRGAIELVPPGTGKKIKGEVTLSSGQILYDLERQIVAKANLFGVANYQAASKDHLFFQAKFSTEPSLEIQYRCSCEQK